MIIPQVSTLIGLHIKYCTVVQIREMLEILSTDKSWRQSILEYGIAQVVFRLDTIKLAYDFLKIESHWCFDYDPHFSLIIRFSTMEDLVLYKLRYL